MKNLASLYNYYRNDVGLDSREAYARAKEVVQGRRQSSQHALEARAREPRDMYEVRQKHPLWFSKDAMRFFKSRVGDKLYGRHYFISSEVPPHYDKRSYTIRKVGRDNKIHTVGSLGQYATKKQAESAIYQMMKPRTKKTSHRKTR
jgi:hypothetical protein